MKFIEWVKDMLFWKKSYQNKNVVHPVQMMDMTSRLLTQAVKETTEASQKLLTKLESVEDQLEDREQLLDIMFQTIPDFLLLKDGDGRWLLLNGYGKKLYGISGRSYKGKTDLEIAELSPRYMENLQQCIKTDEITWESKKECEFEEVSVDHFGKEWIFDVVKTPIFNEDGSRKYLLCHGRNITEEIENEKHVTMLIKALNHASDSIAVTDADHKIIYANESFMKIYGYQKDEVIGKQMSIISSGNTPKEIYKQMLNAISSGDAWTGVLENKTKDGTSINEIVTITPVLNGKTYPVYFICVKRLLERRQKIRKKEQD